MRKGVAVMLVVGLGVWEPLKSPNADVEAGKAAFAAGHWDEALADYDRALRDGDVDPDGLAYNRGTAELKKAEQTKDPQERDKLFQRGLEDLKQAGGAKDPRVHGDAQHNRRNAL